MKKQYGSIDNIKAHVILFTEGVPELVLDVDVMHPSEGTFLLKKANGNYASLTPGIDLFFSRESAAKVYFERVEDMQQGQLQALQKVQKQVTFVKGLLEKAKREQDSGK